MKGLTYYVAVLQVRVESDSCRGNAQGSARGSMGHSSWNPVPKGRPAERQAVAQPCVGDLAKGFNPRGREVWSGN